MKYQVALLIGLLAMTLGHPMPDEENLEKSLENVPVALADQKQEIDSAPAEIVPELKSVIETEKLEATKPTEPMETPGKCL